LALRVLRRAGRGRLVAVRTAFRTRLHSRPQALDLFSGIGGFRLGLERAGMKTVPFEHKADAESAPDIVRKRKAALRGEPARCFMLSRQLWLRYRATQADGRRNPRLLRRSEAAAFPPEEGNPPGLPTILDLREVRHDLGSPRPGSFPGAPPLRISAQRITIPSSR
jgi:C-5 cytosine-specific DNA methylase